MESKELAAKIAEILDSKKGIDIETVDLTGKTVLADYFVICNGSSPAHILASGNSTTQMRALADEVEFVLKKDFDIVPDHIEGRAGDKWILLDYKDVVVHVMGREERENYSIEKFWETKRREGEE